MIKVIYSNAKDFYSLLAGMNEIADDIVLNFAEESIYSFYLTDDKAIMGIMQISKEYLEDYTIDKPLGIKVNINEIKKILGKAKSKTTSVMIDETDAGLKITLRDEKTGLRSNIYVKGEKLEVQQLTEPKVSLPVSFSLEGPILKKILSDASIVTEEEVELSTTEDNGIEFSAEENNRVYKAKLVQDKPLKSVSVESESKSIYKLEVLKTAFKALSFSDDVTISFGTNVPLKGEASTDSGGHLRFWVAPRL
ncbi:DNA polymerase sliding clamp [Stygiolobus caldivivus]|uniref:DNA polymerase sliding clamp n=1 Tax=Stygiolobus caldivivus TaxID=2824673 RepID=A0A8D5ZIJ8_9CREN|nr:DNA polymerase sliding clamp [Stygiolobus caldivivus]BCU70679.1 DNA polymerase III sliding clamp [Stygiolobus caldivivus]